MADDTNVTPAVETAPADASPNNKEKKTRAPRKPKVAPEAVADTSGSAPVRKTRGPAKRAAASIAPAMAAPVGKAPGSAKKSTVAKARRAKSGPSKVETAPVSTDDFADLIKLEEENQKLRKALADKLRAENADLRKKLGIAY